jgi:hypothetical protein
VLIQAVGSGEIADAAQARVVARASVQAQRYEPRPGIDWDERHARLQALRPR